MERIKIDLTPSCVKPILRASQYDNGREWPCDVLKDGTPYKFVEGDVCEIHVRKGDGCGVTASVPVTVGQSFITIASTEQMCAVYGDNIGELVVTNGTKKIGSCNLILSVEADPLNGSKSSASEIHDLQAQVNDCVDEALSHKGASDIAFDNTDTGLEATNVQSAIEEVNTKTDEKADADSVYSKTDTDNMLATKMDKNNPVGTGSFSMNRRSGTTVGQYSHAEGYDCEASGSCSHAEGSYNRASGDSSHAEGSLSLASGVCSHAEGNSVASGNYSHAEGEGTRATSWAQHVGGMYNEIDNHRQYVEIIGNGEDMYYRSNARTLDWYGNEWLAGDLTYNGNKSITSEVARLDSRIDALPDAMIFKGTLGVGGTITELPTASASNEGWTYKVITAGTYAGQYADIGDCFTCYEASENVFSWTISSKGDTDTDTWRAIKVNGVEKLGNGISSGSLDVVDTDNIEAEFDADGNKLKIKTKNIYTQNEVDTLIANAVDSVLPTDSVSKSAVANFETDYAKPIELKAYIEATQDLHGEANPYPSGGGINKWDGILNDGGINDDGTDNTSSVYKRSNYIPVIGDATYYFRRVNTTVGVGYFYYYDTNKDFISKANAVKNNTFTVPNNAGYMRFAFNNVSYVENDISLNYPSTETAYHPYSNICPISGWSATKITRCGKNLLSPHLYKGVAYNPAVGTTVSINDTSSKQLTDNHDGTFTLDTTESWETHDIICPIKEGVVYYQKMTLSSLYTLGTSEVWLDKDFKVLSVSSNTSSNQQKSGALTIPSGAKYYVLVFTNRSTASSTLTITEPQIEVGSTATDYEPYNGTDVTIDLGGTRYGGYLTIDKYGHRQLIVDKGIVDMGSLYWSSGFGGFISRTIKDQMEAPTNGTFGERLVCDTYKSVAYNISQLDFIISVVYGTPTYTYNGYLVVKDSKCSDATSFKNSVSGHYLVYPVAEPIIIDLPDGEPLNALVGTNNLFADSGDMECSFKCGVAMYVDNHSGGGNRSLAKSGGEEPKEEVKDEPLTRQER